LFGHSIVSQHFKPLQLLAPFNISLFNHVLQLMKEKNNRSVNSGRLSNVYQNLLSLSTSYLERDMLASHYVSRGPAPLRFVHEYIIIIIWTKEG
jgi:hypothetical protein